ncbi:MAG: Rho termination factor N-terminal domain-containing protein, partial [Alkalispirochaetaceae bacterium]
MASNKDSDQMDQSKQRQDTPDTDEKNPKVAVKKNPKRKRVKVALIKDSDNGESNDSSAGADNDAGTSEANENSIEQSRESNQTDQRRDDSSRNRKKKAPSFDDFSSKDDKSLSINELSQLNMKELRNYASKIGIAQDNLLSLKKQEVIFAVLKAHTEKGGTIYAYGSLEILPDGYGFLRSPQNSYLSGPDDIYISPSQIRLF